MLDWFRALMPKEPQFFELFTQHAALVVAGAEALQGLLKGGDSVGRYCDEIFAREADADEIARQVLQKVRRSFITPFDRTDIQDLIGSLDDAIDEMNKTQKTVRLFELGEFDDHMRAIARLIHQASLLTHRAMPLLEDIRKNAVELNSLTEQIIQIEEESDRIYDQGRKQLFLKSRSAGSLDPMSFIIGAELFDHLEKVVDRFEDVSNEISALVIDHL